MKVYLKELQRKLHLHETHDWSSPGTLKLRPRRWKRRKKYASIEKHVWKRVIFKNVTTRILYLIVKSFVHQNKMITRLKTMNCKEKFLKFLNLDSTKPKRVASFDETKCQILKFISFKEKSEIKSCTSSLL